MTKYKPLKSSFESARLIPNATKLKLCGKTSCPILATCGFYADPDYFERKNKTRVACGRWSETNILNVLKTTEKEKVIKVPDKLTREFIRRLDSSLKIKICDSIVCPLRTKCGFYLDDSNSLHRLVDCTRWKENIVRDVLLVEERKTRKPKIDVNALPSKIKKAEEIISDVAKRWNIKIV